MSSEQKLTNKDRRAQARVKAQEARDKARKRQKQRKIATWSSVAVGVLAVAAIIAVVIVNGAAPAVPQNNPRNMASDGVTLTSTTLAETTAARSKEDTRTFTKDTDKADVVVYVDYACPHCKEFEAENNASLSKWLNDGDITLEVHPVNVLGTDFSARGANAAACVVDSAPNQFFDFNEQVFEQNTTNIGLTDRDMYSIVDRLVPEADTASTIKNCIKDESFSEWVSEASTTALTEGIATTEASTLTGTPTIVVNGERFPYSYDNQTFTTVMNKIISGEAEVPSDVEGLVSDEEDVTNVG